ncbi:MAG: hypothetical protein GY868_17140 [Deltaproteobacteria bacterium]|nr:hypothetical protein [Deltaproteobacteria bacterium]
MMQRLGEMRIEPAFCFPDGRGTVSLMMVPEAAAAFVQRLRITVKIDQRLLRAAESFVRAADCRSVKVRMRNSGLEWTEGRVVFLLDYFEKMRVDNLLPSLDFVIGFLSEIQDQGDMLEHLIKKKKQLFFSLQLASKAAKALEKGTMETLALSRIKIPHVNVGAVKEKMQIIDQITLNLYRTIETLDHVITGTEYDGMDGDIDKVVKALL